VSLFFKNCKNYIYTQTFYANSYNDPKQLHNAQVFKRQSMAA